jgi:hypothetical protein
VSQTFYYYSRGGAFNIDLGTQAARLGAYGGFQQKAEVGSIGNSTFIIDDPSGTVGNAGDAILGLKSFYVIESDAPAVGSNGIYGQRYYTGFFRERIYRRGDTSRPSLITGVARQITATLEDVNSQAAWRIITGKYGSGKRPAETDVQRIQWILGTYYLPAHYGNAYTPSWTDWNDAGFIDTTNPVNMDANDYTGQTPADVLHDCALASGKNWWFGHWEATGYDFFWYANSETSSWYTSPLRISNVLADVDNVTTFAPEPDAELRRDPSRTFAGVYLAFSAGSSYQTNILTSCNYAWRDGSAPNANIKTQAQADAAATRMLADATDEDDRITCRVQIPSSAVTGIKPGMLVAARFSHLPNACNFAYWRVPSLTVTQDEATDRRYTLSLELTPTNIAAPCTLGAYMPLAGTWSWDLNGGSPNYQPLDPNTVLPVSVGHTFVGSSSYPSPGSPYDYSRVVDRGVSPAPAAAVKFHFDLAQWTNSATYGMSVETSDDGTTWTVAADVPTVWADYDPVSGYFVVLVPSGQRGARYIRFVTHDFFGPPLAFWAGSNFSMVYFAECL